MNLVIPIISVLGVIAAIILGVTLPENPALVIGFVAVLFGGVAFLLAPGAATLIVITFCLLPARSGISPLGYFELFGAAAIVIVGVRSGLVTGLPRERLRFLPTALILLFLIPLVYHGGLGLIGSGESGKRLLLVALVSGAIALLLMTRTLNLSRVSFLPWAGLAVGGVIASFELINYFVPSAMGITHAIYSDQNWESATDLRTGLTQDIRLAGLRDLGFYLAAAILCFFALDRLQKPNRFFLQIIGLIFSTILILLAGYRSYFLALALMIGIALVFRGFRWVFAGGAAVLIALVLLIYWHHAVQDLPLQVQRTLSILPGEWDHSTKESAMGGFEWRENLREIYFRSYFPDSWLLGRGQVLEDSLQSLEYYTVMNLDNASFFVSTQMWHSGLASTLDFTGIVGCVGLAGATLYGLYCCFIVYRRRLVAQPWQVWTGLVFAANIPWFWYTGFFERVFPFYAITIALLVLWWA